jgi:hypothetical protein
VDERNNFTKYPPDWNPRVKGHDENQWIDDLELGRGFIDPDEAPERMILMYHLSRTKESFYNKLIKSKSYHIYTDLV